MERHGQQVASRSITLLHGHVFTPPSRAYLAWQAGEIDEGALNQRESGKFFPRSAGGQPDPFAKDDVVNALPPPDGKIASANQATGALLDQPGDHWTKHEVRSGERLDISWYFSANHVTRRWNYFITRPGWDSAQVLSRDQFEAEPFHTVQIDLQPFWQHGEAMEPVSPTTHEVTLPAAGDQTQYTDRGLQPDTAYSYYVEAVDDEGRVSAPSNELLVKTAGESDYPAWQLNQSYTLGGLVSHVGATWRCLQSHTAYAEDWAPGLPTSETLWANHP